MKQDGVCCADSRYTATVGVALHMGRNVCVQGIPAGKGTLVGVCCN
jgi:hypothetical protein